MHLLIFGHSFAELVALILLPGLAFYFLNKKKASARGNARDADAGASDSLIALTETNSGGSSSFPTETNNGVSSSSPTETSNGTSSSLTASTGNCYEVFLSFRGPDTRKGFTDHLYIGLVDAGIRTFRDDNELRQGEEIGPDLLAAIKNSKILIPILSVNYGSSKWCLDELVQIMECKNNNGQIVLPIFYEVKPADVRYQIGRFGDAFHKREKRSLEKSFHPTILEKWKKALLEVSNLKGYQADGYEGELVKLVVQKVLRELKKEFALVIPENLVGIDGHMGEVMKFVDNNSSATLFIGIHGMGGIGKTTLAKTIYNKLSDQFKYCSFIADIRESCQRNGLEYLQNQLITDILNQNNQISNKDYGINFISSRFKDKKVLILLDDVDDVDQLKALVGNHNWFSYGSRILITTRKVSVLDNEGVDFKYEHKVMDENHSMVLFSRHAFRSNSPPSEFKDLAHDVITTTGGLPLSLEVLGSSLCGKKPAFWRGTIDKSKKVPHQKVRERLRISYEELDYGQKQIFLDIACFFIGDDREITSYMWDACGFYPEEGIEVLIFMSLIKLGDHHKFIMHDQLRDLGREIVREENQNEPQYRSRLWDSKEVLKVLEENKGTDKIEAIILSKGSLEGSDKMAKRDGNIYAAKQFKNLTNLRFLHIEEAHISGDFKDSIKELKWLQCRYCFTNFEIKNFHVTKLAVLELQHCGMNEKWKGWSVFMMAERLKYLSFTDCRFLQNTIFLSAFKHLEVFILRGCSGLKQIDPSIGDMKALLCLDLKGCGSLRKLPTEIESLENLEILDISGTSIEELPKGIGRLRKLRELSASRCLSLKGELPERMCNLSSLQRLEVLYCYKLQSLPNDLPSSLTDLTVTCGSCKLPSLSHLTHLKRLEVAGCKVLECIEVLPSTLSKNSECSQPTDIEESELPQSLNTPFELEILHVWSCRSLKTVDVSQFIHLRTLKVGGCENLVEVRGLKLDKFIYLESLTVSMCDSIERLLLPKSKSLKKLVARRCKKLAEIQGLDRLEFLEILDVSSSDSIKRLDIPKSGRLKILDADACKNLAEIQGLDRLEFLEELRIGGCESLKTIPELSGVRIYRN
ncbi:disease resistance protein L6-like [Syzygium oleosum]|uniref:disease resistance protein L6-like n=1 Tax=Syzygium oleosum TaxID=219896 RepID=UPI0024B9807A|nr:disease resistance protein L6-like [Syzygium oleosum]